MIQHRTNITPFFILGVGALIVLIMQMTFNAYLLTVVNFVFLNIILAVSLNITNGFAGLFSLGHPAFMTIGGYIAALLIMPVSRKETFVPKLPDIIGAQEMTLIPAIIIGGLVAALCAIIIGFPVLRLKGHYLAVATIGFIIIVQVVIRNMEDYTRGALGLNGLMPLTNMWIIYVLLAITLFVAWKIKFSSFGRAMFALRENELAAECLGINLAWSKITVFTIGAFFAGITGGLWAHLTTVITPDSFSIILAFNIVVMVVVGGSGSITGSVFLATLMTVLVELLRPFEEKAGLYGISQIILSALLLIILIVKPRGIFGMKEPEFLFRDVRDLFRFQRKRSQ
jgi:branched-chain amino acid transport system permease protein